MLTPPITRHDIRIIRGDGYRQDVGLGQGYEDVAGNPSRYQLRMVLRAAQNDALPELLAMTSDLVLPEEGDDPEMVVYGQFSASHEETQTLPLRPLVYFTELLDTQDGNSLRLYQGKVDIAD